MEKENERHGLGGPMDSVKQPPKSRESFGKKLLKLFLPRRLHKYLTAEVFIAYNVSSWVTLAQVAVVAKWKEISTFVSSVVVPVSIKCWKAFVEAVKDFMALVFNAS